MKQEILWQMFEDFARGGVYIGMALFVGLILGISATFIYKNGFPITMFWITLILSGIVMTMIVGASARKWERKKAFYPCQMCQKKTDILMKLGDSIVCFDCYNKAMTYQQEEMKK